jgi:hypothetical protein
MPRVPVGVPYAEGEAVVRRGPPAVGAACNSCSACVIVVAAAVAVEVVGVFAVAATGSVIAAGGAIAIHRPALFA